MTTSTIDPTCTDIEETPPPPPADIAAAAARYDLDAIRRLAEFYRGTDWSHLADRLDLTAFDIEVEKVRGRQVRVMLDKAPTPKAVQGKVTAQKIEEMFRRVSIPCRVFPSGNLFEDGVVPGYFVVLPTDGVDEPDTAKRVSWRLRMSLPGISFRVQFRNWATYPGLDLDEVLPTERIGYALATLPV